MTAEIPVHLAVLPWYHTMGAHTYMLQLFVSPTTLVVVPHWDVDLIVKTFSK